MNAQAQVKKVSKVATSSTVKKAATKPVTKKAAPAVKRTVRKAVKATNAVKFVIVDFARPNQGNRLLAFTAAWLELTGLNKGNAMSRAALIAIAGETAINYHTRNGNFEKTEAGLKLSEKGAMFFAARGDVSPDERAGFEVLLKTGKLDERAGIKNEKAVKAA